MILIIFFMLIAALNINACEVCGCGASGSYFALQPALDKNMAGMRWNMSAFDSHLNMGQRFRTQEVFHNAELFLRYYPISRLQVQASIPFAFNKQHTNAGTFSQQGIADISIAVNYNILEKNRLWDSSEFSHALIAGLACKLPTGKWKIDQTNQDEVNNPNFQNGTGSTDFTLMATYMLRYSDLGLTTEYRYRINTANADNYHFGNQLSIGASCFTSFELPDIAIIPKTGALFEYMQQNTQNGVPVSVTGGKALFMMIGTDLIWNSVLLSGLIQIPIWQQLGNGALQNHTRVQCVAGFLF
jgi:hypothetical protein